MAMWNLAKAGYLPRLVNMIHDEVVYLLYPEELDTCIPEIERLMIAGMKMATPDVKVGVETSCMYHWDKDACEYTKLEKDADGRYIIPESDFVNRVYGNLTEEK